MFDIDFRYPGRGAWSSIGGTLNLRGDGPGPYYRSATGSARPIGARAAELYNSAEVETIHINEVAVWRAGMALQKAINNQQVAPRLVEDGIWGPLTDEAFKAFQRARGLEVDGIVGPVTSRALFMPMLESRVRAYSGTRWMRHHSAFLVDLAQATVQLESGWDPGAVGSTTPRDLGISQVNTAVHTDVTWKTAFDPNLAFDKKLSIIRGNFDYALYDIALAVASYNGGGGGAASWHEAGRPLRRSDGTPHWAPRYLQSVYKYALHPNLREALAPWKDFS